MRTTIQLDDHLHDMARQYALSQGKTFTALAEEALRENLTTRPVQLKRKQVKLKTVKRQGAHRGVDLDNNAALLDLMESD